MKAPKWIYAVAASLFQAACAPASEPLNYGVDDCHYCKMSIVEKQYGAELVNDKGKVVKFDAAECMARYMDENPGNYSLVLATPFDQPETLVEVNRLSFLISENLPSPMGANLSAFTTPKACQAKQQEVGGDVHTWDEVRAMITQKYARP